MNVKRGLKGSFRVFPEGFEYHADAATVVELPTEALKQIDELIERLQKEKIVTGGTLTLTRKLIDLWAEGYLAGIRRRAPDARHILQVGKHYLAVDVLVEKEGVDEHAREVVMNEVESWLGSLKNLEP